MTELKADGKNWAVGIFAAVCGAVLSFGTVFMGIALITGLYDWRTEPTFSRFWDSLYSRLTLHIRRPNYEEFLCLAFGAVAGVWGYNSPKLAPALKLGQRARRLPCVRSTKNHRNCLASTAVR